LSYPRASTKEDRRGLKIEDQELKTLAAAMLNSRSSIFNPHLSGVNFHSFDLAERGKLSFTGSQFRWREIAIAG
jgi:hypothetical protein